MTQQEAYDLLRLGHNVFLTGAAGSGKTYLLNRYIAHLKERGVGVAVTASTGIAATHLGGQTIHSWSGLGVRDALSDDDLQKIAAKSRTARNFKNAKVLVIDEISMLHAYQLAIVDRIARHMLDFTAPFGGLQVVLCGDFFQLPPVTGGSAALPKQFAYECEAWEHGDFKTCYLSEQFRQSGTRGNAGGGEDPLLAVLHDIRKGRAGERTKVPLRTRYRKTPVDASGKNIRPTKLFARNVNVDVINSRELNALAGKEKTFHMEARGGRTLVEALKRSCLAPEVLLLKVGAEVMFVKNAADGRYVNGTRGVVTAFEKNGGWPLVRTFDGRTIVAEPDEWRLEEGGRIRASLLQVPLRLAWAITIHKSQGMTLDAAEIDLSDAFEPGMGYVALSRVRSLSGLSLLGLNDTALSVDDGVCAADAEFRRQSNSLIEMLHTLPSEEKQRRHESVLYERFGGSRAAIAESTAGRTYKKPTHDITREHVAQKQPLSEIAKTRGLTEGTIVGHLEKLKDAGALPDIAYLAPPERDFNAIKAAFDASGDGRLTPVFRTLNKKYPFETLRLVRLYL